MSKWFVRKERKNSARKFKRIEFRLSICIVDLNFVKKSQRETLYSTMMYKTREEGECMSM